MNAAFIARDSSTSGTLKVTLSGNWLLGQKLPGPDPVLDRLRQTPKPGNVEFESAALGDWDTGLITALMAIHKSAEANGVAVENSGRSHYQARASDPKDYGAIVIALNETLDAFSRDVATELEKHL